MSVSSAKWMFSAELPPPEPGWGEALPTIEPGRGDEGGGGEEVVEEEEGEAAVATAAEGEG